MFEQLYVYGFLLWLTMTLISAHRWGAWPERTVGWSMAAGTALSVAVRWTGGTRYSNMDLGVVAIDLAFLAIVVLVALRSDRWWPICAAAFQTVTVSGHLARLLDAQMSNMAYALMIGLPSYPLLLALTLGIWNRHRAARQGAGDISSVS